MSLSTRLDFGSEGIPAHLFAPERYVPCTTLFPNDLYHRADLILQCLLLYFNRNVFTPSYRLQRRSDLELSTNRLLTLPLPLPLPLATTQRRRRRSRTDKKKRHIPTTCSRRMYLYIHERSAGLPILKPRRTTHCLLRHI